ncbi:MAG: hypothetical protein OHK0012_13350 [Synechococcales cyanobacterium]
MAAQRGELIVDASNRRFLPQEKPENQMERLVFHMIEEVYMMDSQGRFCQCEKFQNDVAAIVLNRFLPRYATSFEGSVLTLDHLQQDSELQVSIIREVAAAMEVVAKDPRCLDRECPLRMIYKPEPEEEAL